MSLVHAYDTYHMLHYITRTRERTSAPAPTRKHTQKQKDTHKSTHTPPNVTVVDYLDTLLWFSGRQNPHFPSYYFRIYFRRSIDFHPFLPPSPHNLRSSGPVWANMLLSRQILITRCPISRLRLCARAPGRLSVHDGRRG